MLEMVRGMSFIGTEPGVYPMGGGSGIAKPKTWAEVSELVRSGLAGKVFTPGVDQLVCQKNGVDQLWDILGINIDTPADERFKYSMTLQLHDCYTGLQYDVPEALFYCETALQAGTYNFTLLSGYDTAYGGGKTYQFTMTKEVPAGGQITFPWNRNQQALSTKISTYKSRTDTAAIESVSVVEGTDGTNLGTADGKSANMNHTHRIRYGSNNWAESAMRQYLNSDKPTGSVWTPQTKFDRPPNWAGNTAGWMNGIDEDFLAVIGEAKKVTCRNNVTDGGGSDTTSDKFFLLSRRETFMGDEVSSVIEGEPYPYYSEYSDYEKPNTGADKNRIKYRNGAAQYWWLRTPGTWTDYIVRRGNPDGSLNIGDARETSGVAPACIII